MIYNIDKYSINPDQLLEIYTMMNENISLTESLIPTSITSKISEKISDSVEDFSKNICEKFNIHYSSISSDIHKVLYQMDKNINKNGITNSISSGTKSISNIIASALIKSDYLMDDLSDNLDIFGSEDLEEKVLNSLRILIFVLISSTICLIILMILFGPVIGQVLAAIMIAPVIEDAGKSLAVRNDCGDIYNVLFNIFEAGSYISSLTMMGYGLSKAIAIRLPAIAMHSIGTFIQKAFSSDKLLKKLNMDPKNDNDKRKLRMMGQVISTLLHVVFNTLAILLFKP